MTEAEPDRRLWVWAGLAAALAGCLVLALACAGLQLSPGGLPFLYTTQACIGLDHGRIGFGWQALYISAILNPVLLWPRSVCAMIPWTPGLPPGGGWVWP